MVQQRNSKDAETASPLTRLPDFGQSPWLDFVQRGLIESGELRRMIDEWGIRGMTTNPVIFEHAIAESSDYDDAIEELAQAGLDAIGIYDRLVRQDVRAAADLLSSVYEHTDGQDGFVSIEVSPHLAHDADRTVTEAARLWEAIDRPNIMIKVPGTRAGLTALRALLARGINVNVTLLFSVARYREVLEAHSDGLEAALREGRPIERIASVASFFLSRIDTLVDKSLDEITAGGGDRGRQATQLRGRVAITSARVAYEHLTDYLLSARWRGLGEQGASIQRLLWASTSIKDDSYEATKYVEPLIGPHTVNTMPVKTLEAYDATGRPEDRLSGTRGDEASVLESLAALGVDLDAATDQLLREGIAKFVGPYDSLLRTLDRHRREALERPAQARASGKAGG